MNDPISAKNCQLCGKPLQLQYDGVVDPQTREVFQILRCPDCRHGRTWPVPSSMAPYYGRQYYGGRHGFTADYCVRRRVRFVERVARRAGDRRLLDVGCGDGSFLSAARRQGWQVTGTEINPDSARAAALNVFASLDEAATQAPFDCITLWHVLEHLADPPAELASLRRLLAADGVLLLAVPDAESTQAKLWGRRWFHRDVPRHLHHFGRHSLGLHLERSGFHVERAWHGEFEYDLLGWSQSALNWALREPNVFFQILTGRGESLGRAKRSAHTLLGAASCGLALLPTWWDMLSGHAGTLILAARPAVASRP